MQTPATINAVQMKMNQSMLCFGYDRSISAVMAPNDGRVGAAGRARRGPPFARSFARPPTPSAGGKTRFNLAG